MRSDGAFIGSQLFLSAIQVAFRNCVPLGENSSDKDYQCKLWETELIAMAGSRENVENCIAGVVGDNVGTNRDAAKLLEAMFPKVFFIGCQSHAMHPVIEDIAEVPEIKSLLNEVKKIVVTRKSRLVSFDFAERRKRAKFLSNSLTQGLLAPA